MGRGKTLRDLVIESGLTQQQIADMLEVERPRVSAMLNATDMKISTAIRLAKVLRVSLKTLAESIGQDTNDLPDDCGGGDSTNN
jgi:transcriptional regulator with XRE-family HTH domain